ncbi:MAG: hypothetical protein IPM54_36735 [Polyangiaceae bacterium]|nr:hypothetical protein [Polyangiaceae bacterium]
MDITKSSNIDVDNCAACQKRRPWDPTIADVKEQLRSHGVTWPNFVIMHGNDLSCTEAPKNSGKWNATLYVVATDMHGKKARAAKIFLNQSGYFIGLETVLDGTAFKDMKRV